MKVLELHFETAAGKTAKINIEGPKEPVSVEDVKTAMQDIIQAGIFIDKDGKGYTAMKAAKLVDRNVIDYSLE